MSDRDREAFFEALINPPKPSERLVRALAAHQGPLYSLTYPKDTGVDALLAHNLMRLTETCQDVITTMRTSPIQLCKLFRIPPKS